MLLSLLKKCAFSWWRGKMHVGLRIVLPVGWVAYLTPYRKELVGHTETFFCGRVCTFFCAAARSSDVASESDVASKSDLRDHMVVGTYGIGVVERSIRRGRSIYREYLWSLHHSRFWLTILLIYAILDTHNKMKQYYIFSCKYLRWLYKEKKARDDVKSTLSRHFVWTGSCGKLSDEAGRCFDLHVRSLIVNEDFRAYCRVNKCSIAYINDFLDTESFK